MGGANMLDLPDELLLLICHKTNRYTLLTLSVLCRRLHNICLPIYLSHYGVDKPAHVIEADIYFQAPTKSEATLPQLDALSGLRLALFITHTKKMVLSFVHPRTGDHHDMRPIIQQLTRAKALIDKMTSIRKVTLIFNAGLDTASHRCYSCFGKDIDRGSMSCASAYCELLDSILEKTSILTIRKCHFMMYAYDTFKRPINATRPSNLVLRVWSRARNLLSFGSRQPPQVTGGSDGAGSSLAPSHRVLRELSLKQSSLYPFYPTSFGLGHLFSTLTTLWIDTGYLSTPYTYRTEFMLADVADAAQNLSELHLSGRYLTVAVAVDFVCRLPPLTMLVLHDNFRDHVSIIDSHCKYIPTPDLSKIITLHAPPFLLQHFLRHSRSGETLSQLRTIAIHTLYKVLCGQPVKGSDFGLSDLFHFLTSEPPRFHAELKIVMVVSHSSLSPVDRLSVEPGHSAIRESSFIHGMVIHTARLSPMRSRDLARFLGLYPRIRHLELGGKVSFEGDLADAMSVLQSANPHLASIKYHDSMWFGDPLVPNVNWGSQSRSADLP